jgi:FKBP-type peptidyl-prolyl cis-trans isomerase FkpA
MKIILYLFLLISFSSCGGEETSKEEVSEEEIARIRERILEANKAHVQIESKEIDNYIKRRNLSVERTGTGLRYLITKQNDGKQAVSGMTATLKYSISLLDGTVCYSSDSLGLKSFEIDHDQIESGIHEGVKLLKEGEHAIFILPSHLAHGLTGDHNKIPPGSPVVYNIELTHLN